MKKVMFGVSILVLFTAFVGCVERSPFQTEVQKGIEASPSQLVTPKMVSPSNQVSPYPMAESIIEDFIDPTLRPDPETRGETPEELPTSPAGQSPTPHVDIIMRPTNPEAFVMASGKYQLVEFFAFWCPTCKSMAPVLRNLEHKYLAKIQFIYLDIDDPKTNPFKQAFGYQYQPHIFLIDGEGKVVMQWVGYVAEEELDAVLNSLQ